MMIATQAASFAADATRQLLTLATGVLAVTVTFMSDLVPNPSKVTITLMAAGWLFLLVGIVAGIVCLFALASEVARAEKDGGEATRASIRRKPILIAAQAQAVAFLAGLVLISVAATLSLA